MYFFICSSHCYLLTFWSCYFFFISVLFWSLLLGFWSWCFCCYLFFSSTVHDLLVFHCLCLDSFRRGFSAPLVACELISLHYFVGKGLCFWCQVSCLLFNDLSCFRYDWGKNDYSNDWYLQPFPASPSSKELDPQLTLWQLLREGAIIPCSELFWKKQDQIKIQQYKNRSYTVKYQH